MESRAKATASSQLLPSENTFDGRSSDRPAKINERLKLGKPGRALNGDLWVSLPQEFQATGQPIALFRDQIMRSRYAGATPSALTSSAPTRVPTSLTRFSTRSTGVR